MYYFFTLLCPFTIFNNLKYFNQAFSVSHYLRIKVKPFTVTYKVPLDLVFIGIYSLIKENTVLSFDLFKWGWISGNAGSSHIFLILNH